MASIDKRPNGKYRARYRDGEGKEHARHFPRKVDAQNWLDQITTAVVTGQYVDPRAGRITLKAYASTWEAAQVGRERTLGNINNALRLHILPVLGDRPMASIRPSDVQGLVKHLSGRLKPGTVRNINAILVRLFNAAVDDRVVAVSPCRKVTLPRPEDIEVVPLTVEEVTAVIEAMPDRYRAAAVLLAGSGLRIGELLGLKVGDIRFLERSIRVERQRSQRGQIGPTKSPKSTRTVPLGDVVLEVLAAHIATFKTREWLFVDEHGEPLHYQVWKVVLRAASSEAKVDLTSHAFRHFFASALIAGGASVKQVQTVLGHSSAMVTLHTYAHLWPGDNDRTRAVIDSTLGDLRTDRGPEQTDVGELPGQTS